MEMMMAGRSRRRSRVDLDLQNWLGSGALIKVGVCLQDVSERAARMF